MFLALQIRNSQVCIATKFSQTDLKSLAVPPLLMVKQHSLLPARAEIQAQLGIEEKMWPCFDNCTLIFRKRANMSKNAVKPV